VGRGGDRINLAQGRSQVAGSCKNDNDTSDSIQCGKCLI